MIKKETCRHCGRETFLIDSETKEGYCLYCERYVRLRTLHNSSGRGAGLKITPGEVRILQRLIEIMSLSELSRVTGYHRHTLNKYLVKKGEASETH